MNGCIPTHVDSDSDGEDEKPFEGEDMFQPYE